MFDDDGHDDPTDDHLPLLEYVPIKDAPWTIFFWAALFFGMIMSVVH